MPGRFDIFDTTGARIGSIEPVPESGPGIGGLIAGIVVFIGLLNWALGGIAGGLVLSVVSVGIWWVVCLAAGIIFRKYWPFAVWAAVMPLAQIISRQSVVVTVITHVTLFLLLGMFVIRSRVVVGILMAAYVVLDLITQAR